MGNAAIEFNSEDTFSGSCLPEMADLPLRELEDAVATSLSWYNEGKVLFLAPVRKTVVSSSDAVFYNPRMEFQRDVSICVTLTYSKMMEREMDLCEPLASCGVRAIRWACEVPGIRHIVAGDINQKAVLLANINACLNNVLGKVEFFRADARFLLDTNSSFGQRFDVVDIDPFGSPVNFIDPAIKSLKKEGGLLCLTATDMQPLCGIHQDACLRKYGGRSLRTEYCHEIAVRLVIGAAAWIAARHNTRTSVLFSHSSDHYVRAYLSMKKNAIDADKSIMEIGCILHCFNCGNRKITRSIIVSTTDLNCELCGSKMRIAGPLWCGDLWSKEFVHAAKTVAEKLEYTFGQRRMMKMLDSILSELNGPITYYDLHYLSEVEGTSSPSTSRMVQLLRENGFFASPTHFRGTGVRTSADIKTIRSLMKQLE
jgi:tRNA (guanine26-N2/guanine27-N2)-dimethyltransferase